jgi:RNA polymerase sigma-70 factor (ECF subfamily)
VIEKLYSLYFSEIVNYAASLTKSRPEAEDITQETFLRALANLDLLQELSDQQCRSWLYKTTRNIFVDRVRKNARQFPEEITDGYADDLSVFTVAELLKSLPQEEASLFWLRYFWGYRASELAAMYAMPPGTIRSKLWSARKKLRDMLESQRREENENHEKTSN